MGRCRKNHSGLPELRRDARDTVNGAFQKDIGSEQKESGRIGQARFRFGTDASEALIRYLAVDALWSSEERAWQQHRLTEQPLWTPLGLKIARAIAKDGTKQPVKVTL